MVVERLGVAPVNERMRSLGLPFTTLYRKSYTPDTDASREFGLGMTTPDEIAATLSYVRNSWGNKASLVSPEQVAAILKETEKRSDPWTAEELLKVPLAAGVPAMAALTPEQLKQALKALPADALDALLKDVKK